MNRLWQYGASLALIQLLGACSPSTPAENRTIGVTTTSNVTTSVVDSRLVVAFGDSLYAGYNLAPDQGFAPVLEKALDKRGVKARVFNAGVSGDTSAAGLQRLEFMLDGLDRKPDLVIVGLGANDMLRGLSPEATRNNLDTILGALKKRGIPAMLTGMLAAPNMGPDYARAFNPIYPALAKKYDAPLYGFFLDGVIGQRDLLLPDGMHPNAKGISAIVERVAPIVTEQFDDRAR